MGLSRNMALQISGDNNNAIYDAVFAVLTLATDDCGGKTGIVGTIDELLTCAEDFEARRDEASSLTGELHRNLLTPVLLGAQAGFWLNERRSRDDILKWYDTFRTNGYARLPTAFPLNDFAPIVPDAALLGLSMLPMQPIQLYWSYRFEVAACEITTVPLFVADFEAMAADNTLFV